LLAFHSITFFIADWTLSTSINNILINFWDKTITMHSLLSQLAVLAGIASTVNAIPTISVKGAKFFADGQQFLIKGKHLFHIRDTHG